MDEKHTNTTTSNVKECPSHKTGENQEAKNNSISHKIEESVMTENGVTIAEENMNLLNNLVSDLSKKAETEEKIIVEDEHDNIPRYTEKSSPITKHDNLKDAMTYSLKEQVANSSTGTDFEIVQSTSLPAESATNILNMDENSHETAAMENNDMQTSMEPQRSVALKIVTTTFLPSPI